MHEFCVLCNIDIFEVKDKRREGIEHRFVKQWPVHLTTAEEIR